MQRNIDIEQEQLISLKELAQQLPKCNGKRTHYSTVNRWANKGTGGRKLETVKIGGRRYTSWEALKRFAAAESVVNLQIQDSIAQVLANDGV